MPPDSVPPRTWWSRHWKWVVPVGCLTPVVACGGGFALLITLAFGMMKNSVAYQDSLAMVQTDSRMQQQLGTPIEPGWLVTGNLAVSNGSGNADLSYDVSGPNGDATVYVVATKTAGVWDFVSLVVRVHATNQRIDLLAPAPTPPALPVTTL